MSPIPTEEYHKLKKQNETYMILGIIFLFVATPLGAVFLILWAMNNQKIKEYEQSGFVQQPPADYYAPAPVPPAEPPVGTPVTAPAPVQTTMQKTCSYCNTILDAESLQTIQEKGFVFCTNCGNRIEP